MRNLSGIGGRAAPWKRGRSEMEMREKDWKTGLNDMFGGEVGSVLWERDSSATGPHRAEDLLRSLAGCGHMILIRLGAVVKCGA